MIFMVPKIVNTLIEKAMEDELVLRRKMFNTSISYSFSDEIVNKTGIVGFECDYNLTKMVLYITMDFFSFSFNLDSTLNIYKVSFYILDSEYLNKKFSVYYLPSQEYLNINSENFNNFKDKTLYIKELNDLFLSDFKGCEDIKIAHYTEDIYSFMMFYNYRKFNNVYFENLTLNVDEDEDIESCLLFLEEFFSFNVAKSIKLRFYFIGEINDNLLNLIECFNFPNNVQLVFNIWHFYISSYKNKLKDIGLYHKIELEVNSYFN